MRKTLALCCLLWLCVLLVGCAPSTPVSVVITPVGTDVPANGLEIPETAPLSTASALDAEPQLLQDAQAVEGLFLPTPLTWPTSETVLIAANCSRVGESPVTILDNQAVTLYWRWDARTSQQIETFLDAADDRVTLDGQVVPAQRRTEIEYMAEQDIYRITWFADIGALAPGIHHSERKLSWAYPIEDGWATYGPGTEIDVLRDGCEIIVQSSGESLAPTILPE